LAIYDVCVIYRPRSAQVTPDLTPINGDWGKSRLGTQSPAVSARSLVVSRATGSGQDLVGVCTLAERESIGERCVECRIGDELNPGHLVDVCDVAAHRPVLRVPPRLQRGCGERPNPQIAPSSNVSIREPVSVSIVAPTTSSEGRETQKDTECPSAVHRTYNAASLATSFGAFFTWLRFGPFRVADSSVQVSRIVVMHI
jgi:hypothetical protein